MDRPRGRQAARAIEDDDEGLEVRRGNGAMVRRRPRYDVARRRPPSPLPMAYAVSDTLAMALERGAAIVGDNVRAFQDETARFLTRRADSDLEAMEQIARSRSLLEIFSVQQRWLSTMASDYSQEMIRLSRLTGSAVEDTVAAERMRED